MARTSDNVEATAIGSDDDLETLEQIIATRDREITGLYLVFSELGVSQDLAWTRAAELLDDRNSRPGRQ